MPSRLLTALCFAVIAPLWSQTIEGQACVMPCRPYSIVPNLLVYATLNHDWAVGPAS